MIILDKELIICPKCKKKKIVKAGFINNQQRYKCKTCSYHFTINEHQKPDYLKRMAILLRLQGYSYRQIEKLLGVSNVCVFKWIDKYTYNIRKISAGKTRKPIYFRSFDIEKAATELEKIDNKIMMIVFTESGTEQLFMFK